MLWPGQVGGAVTLGLFRELQVALMCGLPQLESHACSGWIGLLPQWGFGNVCNTSVCSLTHCPHPHHCPHALMPSSSPSPSAIQGSNSVSWAASFMSARQVQGEGQGEGQDQSNLLKDQSVGAYFIQKSAKLEELELPPSPEGQVRMWL